MIYGNPAYEHIRAIKNSILLREWNRLGVFDPLKVMPYPGELETVAELKHLVALQDTVDSPRLAYCKLVDVHLYEVMSEYLASYGVTASAEEIQQQVSIYDPIIDYLKVLYNRPRPFQTAAAYGVPLYPLVRTDASDSSYPSGHTLLALFFRHIYMQSHPDLAKALLDFVLDIKLTREQGGVHYPSDGVFSMHIYKHIKPWMTARTTIYSRGVDKLDPM